MNKRLLAGLGILFLVMLLTASTTINGVRIIAGDLTVQGTTTLANGAALGSPASIVLPSGATGTTQSALDNSTKIATTAYVDTSRGMKGSAIITTNGSAITSSTLSGIITGVARNSAGNYSVTMTSPPANTIAVVSNNNDGVGLVVSQVPDGSGTSLANPWTLVFTRITGGNANVDPRYFTIAAFAY